MFSTSRMRLAKDRFRGQSAPFSCARGDEQDVSCSSPPSNVAGLEHDVEPKRVDVEVPHAVDVAGAQVHVAHSHLGIDWALRCLHRIDRSLGPAHDAAFTTRRGIWNGSEVTTPPSTASIGAPAASSRALTTVTSLSDWSSTVQWRRPTTPGGCGGTPCPSQVLKPR